MAPRRGGDRCTSRRTAAVLGLFACAGWALACGGSPRPPSLADSGALGSDSTPDGDHDAGVALDAGARDRGTLDVEVTPDAEPVPDAEPQWSPPCTPGELLRLPSNPDYGLGPVLSGDGRYIAIATTEALDPADTNGLYDTYVYDRFDESYEWLGVDEAGRPGLGRSAPYGMSDDGRLVLFTGEQLLAVPPRSSGALYLRDRWMGRTEWVSVSTRPDPVFCDPILAADGTVAGWAGERGGYVPNDMNGDGYDVFLRDLILGESQIVSRDGLGQQLETPTVLWALSRDARVVAFGSHSALLDGGPDPGYVYVRDLTAGTTVNVCTSSTGVISDWLCTAGLSLSGDGRFVSFRSGGRNLVPGAVDDVFVSAYFVKDVATGRIQSVLPPGVRGWVHRAKLSPTGRYVALASPDCDLYGNNDCPCDIATHYIRDLWSSALWKIGDGQRKCPGSSAVNGGGARIEWSADERFIGFISDQVLTPTAPPNAVHTYVYSFCAGR